MGTVHHTETIHKGKMEFETVINGHSITLDTSPAGGGENKGASPKPLLLSALAGCTGMDVAGLLNKMRVEYSDFSLDVDADLTDEHPRVYSEIRLIYRIKVKEEDKEKMEKAVHLSKTKYCGVSAMLSKVCPVIARIEYL